jgi:hypothetical protein
MKNSPIITLNNRLLVYNAMPSSKKMSARTVEVEFFTVERIRIMIPKVELVCPSYLEMHPEPLADEETVGALIVRLQKLIGSSRFHICNPISDKHRVAEAQLLGHLRKHYATQALVVKPIWTPPVHKPRVTRQREYAAA